MIAAIRTPSVDWLALSPTLALLGAGGVALLGAVFFPRALRRELAAGSCLAGYVGAFVAACFVWAHTTSAHTIVGGGAFRDRYAILAQLVISACGGLAVLVSLRERSRDDHVAEYYALLAAAGAGMAFFVQAANLMTLFLGLEWFSICLYVLCAIDLRRERSLEAGLKYLIVGSFGSGFLLFGSALVYGATGELRFTAIARAIEAQGLRGDALLVAGLAMLIAGMGFKASAAPFHQWTPDVYEGAPTPVTAFMAAATKVAALVLMLRVLTTAFPAEAHLWTVAVAVIACLSLAIGNLAALVQRGLKRLLAYSSISHAGFMLIAVAADNSLGGRALLYYLIPYSAMSIGAFAIVAARERELGREVTVDDMAGFGWERPLHGVAMWTFMFGFAGFPLTGGFLGKFYVFSAAYRHGWTWLIIVGAIATAVSLYYYLAVVRAMYMRRPGEVDAVGRPAVAGGSPPRDLPLTVAVVSCLVVTVGSFFAVQPLIDLARDAAGSLPF